jgi:arylsulfatase A-like enzyme
MPENIPSSAPKKPNIVVIMVDDLGYSDLGCYGGEISTPNIDSLGYNGLRFTQMYNGARCCPSRAALLTGLHPHQAGIGQLTADLGVPSYQGYLRDGCVTIAEVMKTAGYRTMISGKWHVASSWDARDRDNWILGDKKHPMPKQRGFDRSFGILNAAESYWNPKSLILEDVLIDVETEDFHLTDAIADHAVEQIDESIAMDKPFFQYVAFSAPHWPLHAREDDIVKYEGKYMAGYDAMRTSRHEQQKGLGVVDDKWDISPRDSDSPDWKDVRNKEYEDIRMATYAAMVEQVDRGVGRIIDTLRAQGEFDNTVIMFLSDNGGCAELFQEDGDWPDPSLWETELTLQGDKVRAGDIPELRPGPDTTFQAVELPWANVSDTPFRLFKRWIHEGGISTPFIVHWPDQIEKSNILDNPMHIIDISATCYEIAGAQYPTEHHDTEITPLEGESFLPALQGRQLNREQAITIEHEGNRGIRIGDWKLVAEWNKPWEMYNISDDRTEQNNLIDGEKDRAKAFEKTYFEWAERAEVLPWPVDPNVVAKRLKGDHAHITQHRAPANGVMK